MLNRFPFLPPESSRPGVQISEADFSAFGAGRVPFSGGRFTLEPGATSRPDTHQVSECWMIAQGSGTVTYDGTEHAVSTGDYLFFEPQKTHFAHNDGSEVLAIHTVWWLEQD
ncbi:cupin domain-containing protein [Streptomyces profundus]|uniref:cupin domain-containing protein n=1 Tax=Streptomyces profundus TaxID=2867410 RepID=UPI001D1698EF|nr:cupin domain-containing protein [Streptomyces sp. MA3_2.13]UED87530.1 cupin domain-containing protein [Streptomyces sp. MA3_2.13]